MTIKQIDKKIDDIENYYNQFNMCSYEYPSDVKRQLSRLYNLKLKKMATNWKDYIKETIKIGLESPTPYKVIPYKNGIGIKKIEFIK